MSENTLYPWRTDDDLVGERVILGTTDGAKRGVVLATCKSLLKVQTEDGVYIGNNWIRENSQRGHAMTNHEDEDRRGRPFARMTDPEIHEFLNCPQATLLREANEELREIGLALADRLEDLANFQEEIADLHRRICMALGASSEQTVTDMTVKALDELARREGKQDA